MKLVKQRFTQWYNRRQGRKGTLWEERFKSVLVEGAGEALAAMAAYIDLNPVRAGLVEDPRDYRWSGYGQAVGGCKRLAREGLRVVIAGAHRVGVEQMSFKETLEGYRQWLYGQGEAREGTDAAGKPLRRGFSREEVAEVLAAKGRLPVGEYVRVRVRYFSDGLVLGSRGFVEEMFGVFRDRFGPKRKDGARRLRGVASDQLYAMRDLRIQPVG